MELAVRGLPQHETRQPHFAVRLDDQIGILTVIRVQVFVERIRVELPYDPLGYLPRSKLSGKIACAGACCPPYATPTFTSIL